MDELVLDLQPVNTEFEFVTDDLTGDRYTLPIHVLDKAQNKVQLGELVLRQVNDDKMFDDADSYPTYGRLLNHLTGKGQNLQNIIIPKSGVGFVDPWTVHEHIMSAADVSLVSVVPSKDFNDYQLTYLFNKSVSVDDPLNYWNADLWQQLRPDAVDKTVKHAMIVNVGLTGAIDVQEAALWMWCTNGRTTTKVFRNAKISRGNWNPALLERTIQDFRIFHAPEPETLFYNTVKGRSLDGTYQTTASLSRIKAAIERMAELKKADTEYPDLSIYPVNAANILKEFDGRNTIGQRGWFIRNLVERMQMLPINEELYYGHVDSLVTDAFNMEWKRDTMPLRVRQEQIVHNVAGLLAITPDQWLKAETNGD